MLEVECCFFVQVKIQFLSEKWWMLGSNSPQFASESIFLRFPQGFAREETKTHRNINQYKWIFLPTLLVNRLLWIHLHSNHYSTTPPHPPPVLQVATECCRRGSRSPSGRAEGRNPSASRSRRTARPPLSCSWPTSPWRGSPSPQPAPGPRWGTLPFRPPGPPCYPPAPPAPAGTCRGDKGWRVIYLCGTLWGKFGIRGLTKR